MKKLAGIVRCTFVSPDDGKNGLDEPRPSSSILVGTVDGFRMTCVALAREEASVAATGAATAAIAATAQATATGARSPGAPRRRTDTAPPIASGRPPANDRAMCTGSSHRHRPAAPRMVIRRPNARPAPKTAYASQTALFHSREGGGVGTAAPAALRPQSHAAVKAMPPAMWNT